MKESLVFLYKIKAFYWTKIHVKLHNTVFIVRNGKEQKWYTVYKDNLWQTIFNIQKVDFRLCIRYNEISCNSVFMKSS